VINTNGTFSYTPAKDYFGNDSFTYSACDVNGACDNAVVTLIINSVNDRPVAVYDVVVVNEDEVLNGDLLANASDTEGDAILFNETPVSNPAHGTLIIHSNGTFTYTPDADFNGLDSFYFEMCDANGGCTQSAIIVRTMSVNDVPLAMDDICYAQQNTSVTVNLLSNDEGLGDGGLKLSWVNPEHGTVVLVNDSTITYRPNPGFDGVEYFRYTICDSENECSEALVTINATGCDLIIPEGFSPNGDGVNDLFVMPDLNRFTKVSIEVFNRWGNVVYKVNKYENNWNGESNVGFSIGKELPTGTYFYIITISDNNKKYTGYIYLNR
jgi:gliding motility-associated-like protein